MPSLINEDQTYGVQGRNIQENLMVLRDVIDYVNLYNKDAAIISIDQEKAFDRIEWRSVWFRAIETNIIQQSNDYN